MTIQIYFEKKTENSNKTALVPKYIETNKCQPMHTSKQTVMRSVTTTLLIAIIFERTQAFECKASLKVWLEI